jgi:hypothetical protein
MGRTFQDGQGMEIPCSSAGALGRRRGIGEEGAGERCAGLQAVARGKNEVGGGRG